MSCPPVPPEFRPGASFRMTARSLLRYADIPVSRWRNGGGETREICVYPPGAGDAFLWRLSAAHIRDSGPFSAFPGIDRHLLLTSPNPLSLRIDGVDRTVSCGEAAHFPGEAAVGAHVPQGPASAINLMVRRGSADGVITVEHHDGMLRIEDPHTVAVVLLAGTAELSGAPALVRGDTLLPGPLAETLACSGATLARITVRPPAQPEP